MNKYQKAFNTIYDTLVYYMVRRDENLLHSDNEIYDAQAVLSKLVDKADSFEWIPVSERLPEPINEDSESDYNIFDVYLVSVGEESHPIRALWDGRCFCDAMYRMLLGVKAWMPLPEPYKENENETR